MEHLTENDVAMLAAVLRAEGMACKKARVYAHTLTDTALAEEMAVLAADHEDRYKSLYYYMSGVQL